MKKIACCHPGKIGDVLFALPAIRTIAEQRGCLVDFWTSKYCAPLRKLFEYQSCINKFYISQEYKVSNTGRGLQPYQVPVPSNYDVVYQMGFMNYPKQPLHEYIGKQCGVMIKDIHYEYPNEETLNVPYVVFAPGRFKEYGSLMRSIIKVFPVPVVIVGNPEEDIGMGVNKTGIDLLDELVWIANSWGFLGTMSSHMVLAQGFTMPKIALWHKGSCDPQHWLIRDDMIYTYCTNIDGGKK